MLITSSIVQIYASLGLQIVVRNLGPMISLPIERMMNEPLVADVQTWLSMAVIFTGACLYVVESLGVAPYHVNNAKSQDVSTLALGIFLMMINMIVAIFERMWQRKLIALEKLDISKTGMLLLNNSLCVIPVAFLIFPLGEYKEENVRRWSIGGSFSREWYDWVLLVVSGVCGMGIGWT